MNAFADVGVVSVLGFLCLNLFRLRLRLRLWAVRLRLWLLLGWSGRVRGSRLGGIQPAPGDRFLVRRNQTLGRQLRQGKNALKGDQLLTVQGVLNPVDVEPVFVRSISIPRGPSIIRRIIGSPWVLAPIFSISSLTVRLEQAKLAAIAVDVISQLVKLVGTELGALLLIKFVQQQMRLELVLVVDRRAYLALCARRSGDAVRA